VNDEKSTVAHSLTKAGIPTGDAKTLFTILDADVSGSITFDELLAGCARIRGAAGSMEWDMLTMQATMRVLVKQMKRLHKEVRTVVCGTMRSPGAFRSNSSEEMESPRMIEEKLKDQIPMPESTGNEVSPPAGFPPGWVRSPGPRGHGDVQAHNGLPTQSDDSLGCSTPGAASLGVYNMGLGVGICDDSPKGPLPYMAGQIAFQTEFMRRLEADAAARVAQHDLLLRLEAESRAQAAAQAQIIERLETGAAKQDEIMNRLSRLETQADVVSADSSI
jgi:hypothetical protein